MTCRLTGCPRTVRPGGTGYCADHATQAATCAARGCCEPLASWNRSGVCRRHHNAREVMRRRERAQASRAAREAKGWPVQRSGWAAVR